MGELFENDLVPGPRVRQQSRGVAHGAGGYEKSAIHARLLRRQFFQAFDGGILPVHVIAKLGPAHRPSHLFGRQGDGIASQVYDALWHGRINLLFPHLTATTWSGYNLI